MEPGDYWWGRFSVCSWGKPLAPSGLLVIGTPAGVAPLRRWPAGSWASVPDGGAGHLVGWGLVRGCA